MPSINEAFIDFLILLSQKASEIVLGCVFCISVSITCSQMKTDRGVLGAKDNSAPRVATCRFGSLSNIFKARIETFFREKGQIVLTLSA